MQICNTNILENRKKEREDLKNMMVKFIKILTQLGSLNLKMTNFSVEKNKNSSFLPFDFTQGKPFDFTQGKPFDFTQNKLW